MVVLALFVSSPPIEERSVEKNEGDPLCPGPDNDLCTVSDGAVGAVEVVFGSETLACGTGGGGILIESEMDFDIAAVPIVANGWVFSALAVEFDAAVGTGEDVERVDLVSWTNDCAAVVLAAGAAPLCNVAELSPNGPLPGPPSWPGSLAAKGLDLGAAAAKGLDLT